ncbi:MAG: glycosyltransferase family 2 protein [Patescibacteria group bacterium]
MLDLSVVILSYNTKNITLDCLTKLHKSLKSSNIKSEIIIVDNDSKDGSVEMLKDFKQNLDDKIKIKLTFNKKNYGYPKGNNQGLKLAEGRNILFYNSDVLVEDIDWKELISYFNKKQHVGALTVEVLLTNNKIDPASHRGFPTVWNSFCYFSKLEKVLGNIPFLNKVFGGYHMTHKNLNTIHEIDSPSGAFYLTKKSLIDEVGGFDDKTFFLYGEDLDLSYRIKELGYKVLYYPNYSVLHLKSVSGLKKKNKKIKKKSKEYFYDAMKNFYKKHYINKYPNFINKIVFLIIDLKRKTA